MTKLVNRAKMTTASTGTGTITLGSAVDGYQTFSAAGVADADVVRYVIEDGTAWEIGLGTYTASGTTLTRGSIESSNADNALNLTGNAVVYVSAAAADLQELVDFADNFVLPTSDGSTGQVLQTDGAGTLSFTTISGYTDSDVDTHLNTGTASSGEVLSWTGSDYDWVAVSGGATDIDGLSDGVSDGSSIGFGVGTLSNVSATGNNIAIGVPALRGASGSFAGDYNIGLGYLTGDNLTSGSDNTFLGRYSGYNTSSGGDNFFAGYFAGSQATTSSNHIAIGREALRGDVTSKLTGASNIGLGYQTGYDLSTGAYNFLGGYLAGTNLTTGSYNVALGQRALDVATTAIDNIAIGRDAVGNNTSGEGLVGIGFEALKDTTASGNIGIGYSAGRSISSGQYNTVIGQAAANAGIGNLTTGSNNTVIGYNAAASSATVSNEITLGDTNITRFRIPGIQSGATNGDVLTYDSTNGILSLQAPAGGGATDINGLSDGYSDGFSVGLGSGALEGDDGTSNYNTAIGKDASKNVTTGTNNIGIGWEGLRGNSTSKLTGSNNIGIGYQTGFDLTTGTYNFLVGNRAGTNLTTGSGNVAIGRDALYFSATTVSDNVSIGTYAGGGSTSIYGVNIGGSAGYWSQGAYNIGIGYQAMRGDPTSKLTGARNVGIGDSVGIDLTTGGYNFLGGYLAGTNLTTGSNNVAIGNGALDAATTGGRNIAIGQSAMGLGVATASTGDNVAIGYQAGYDLTSGTDNILIGESAGANITTGSYSIAIGYQALDAATTPLQNIAIGERALSGVVTGTANTVVGSAAGLALSTSNNTLIGHNAAAEMSTGANNTALGAFAGYGTSGTFNNITGNNNIWLGYNATGSALSASNEITLGNTSIATLRCATTTITSISDARDKTDIQPLNAGLEFVEALNPVSFTWNMRDGGKVGDADTGFIAQDLQAAQADTGVTIPGLVFDANPEKLEAGYGKLIPVLVQAIKDLSAEVKDLKAQLEAK